MNLLRQHLRSAPNDLRAMYLLGRAAFETNDNTTAETVYRNVLAQRPSDPVALYSLGLVVARMGRIGEARNLFSAVTQIDPSFTRAHEQLARLDGMLGKPAQGGGAGGAATATMGAAPAKPDDTSRLTAGELLRSGSRNLGSFAGRVLIALGMALLGGILYQTSGPGRLMWLADRMTFPPPSYFAELLERTRGTPIESITQRDYDNAVAAVAATSAVLDQVLLVLTFALPILAGLLILHAVVSAATTRYRVFERRIDFVSGVFNRKRRSAWLFEITDVQFRQPFWLALTGNAQVRLKLQDNAVLKITGFGSSSDQELLWEEIRDAAIVERRSIKNVWV